MSALAVLDRYWRAELPAERLAALRVLIGGFATIYLVARVHVLVGFGSFDPSRFEPVGLATPLTGPLPEPLVSASWGLALLLGIAFTLGYRFRFVGPAFALLFLWVTSYRNSWGMVFHTENLTAIHLLVLGLCPAADALALDATSDGASPARRRDYGWGVRLLCAVTVIAYLIAGLAKWRNSGWDWLEGEVLRNYIAYDCLRKQQVGSIFSPLGAWAVQYAWPFPIIGVATMVLELGAPLALLAPRLGQAWAIGMFGFHVGVLATMAIAFPYPLSGIAFAPFFEAERVFRWRPLAPLRRWLTPAER